MKRMMMVLVLVAACGDDDGAMDSGTDVGTDAPAIDAAEDAPAIDAGMEDAGPTHCGDSLLIAEYDPMTSITIYNPTAEAIDLSGTAWVLCQRPNYFLLDIIEPDVTIPANASHTFDLPTGFLDQDEEGGEIVLYEASAFANPDAIQDYICWGTGRADSRRSVAEEAGIWSGECAPAITGDALRRLPETDGASADSYDPTGAAADLTCP